MNKFNRLNIAEIYIIASSPILHGINLCFSIIYVSMPWLNQYEGWVIKKTTAYNISCLCYV